MSQEPNDVEGLAIEVVFALPNRQELISLTVEAGTDVESAIRQSAISEIFPEEDFSNFQAGIWGKPVKRDYLLNDGDRLELYRPLSMDPREARRQLAAIGSSMGQAVDRPASISDDNARDPD